MLKPMLKLVRKEEEDRGVKAPVLLARPNRLARRLGQAGRGYVLAGAGVVVVAVGFVSLLSWLAPDSDRPIANPLEAVERILPSVLEQVDDQVAALLGTDGETVLRDVRENLTAVGSRIPWASERLRETATNRSASTSPAAPAPAVRSTSNTAAQGSLSSPTTNESPRVTREPSPPSNTSSLPSSTSPPSSPSETAAPATEPLSPTPADEPAAPPPATEVPPAPPAQAPIPPAEEPSAPPAEEPPAVEEPPPVSPPPPPPATDEPTLPPAEEPPPTTDQPPVADQPSPPPQPPRGPAELAKG